MSELKLIALPNPVLRKKAAKVEKVTEPVKELLGEMAKSMYLHQGVGLAAPQVGIDKQLAVIDVGEGLIKLINPVIVKKSGLATEEEGCLSVPGLTVKVKRAKSVIVNFLNDRGEVSQLKAEGLLARALQHELDHLAGVLIVDYINPIKKMLLKVKKVRGLDKRILV